MKTHENNTQSAEQQLKAATDEARRQAANEARNAELWNMRSLWWVVGWIAILAIFFIIWLT